jgi:hypothetical protein
VTRASRLILTRLDSIERELGDFRADTKADVRHLSERVDGVNTRLDTVIDAVAQLRTDFANHTHD